MAGDGLRLPGASTLRLWLVAALVFVLPLHTVFLSAWVSWKPFLILLIVLGAWDLVEGFQQRRWPWHGPASIAGLVFLAAMAVSWLGEVPDGRSVRLWLSLGVGALLLLVMERALRVDGIDRVVMRSIVWSAAAMAVSAVVLSFVVIGSLGAGTLDWIDAIPGVSRVAKAAYLEDGFVALTNWHQDPGYAAAWMNLWAALVIVAWSRREGFARWWVNVLIVAGLGVGSFMTMSRTGWLGFFVALLAASLFLIFKDRLPAARVAAFAAAAVAAAIVLVALLWAIDPPNVGADLGEEVSYRIIQGGSLGAPQGGGTGVQDTRSVVWPRYVEEFRTDPVLGIGLGVAWGTPGLQEPHNLGLQLLGETGLVGLLAFLALAFVVGHYGGGTIGAVALTVVAATILTQTVLFEPTLWFAAALYLGRIGVPVGDSRKTSTSPIQL
ncbi:MAG: hypothetical protein BMS9Abin07_1157 [Acidimicrobiia bacterium]|nr:MAG: hypothetical protein BMS9Abin07_1157 [Acidimicrobiia bacterium]